MAVHGEPARLNEGFSVLAVGVGGLAEQRFVVSAHPFDSLGQHSFRQVSVAQFVDGIHHVLLLHLQQVLVLQVMHPVVLILLLLSEEGLVRTPVGNVPGFITAAEVVDAVHFVECEVLLANLLPLAIDVTQLTLEP